jgi:hypothetical protein
LLRIGFYVEHFVGGELEGEAEVKLVAGGRRWQKKVVGEAGEVLGGGWSDSRYASGEPGLWRDGDLGATGGNGRVDFVRGVAN